MPTFVDLFSGAGLFSAGFQEAGFRPLLAIDAEPNAVASYNLNVAAVAVAESIERPKLTPRADVIIAGPPCQGFSSLGPRDPSDDRNELCLAISGWASATDAAIVIVENVPPFLKSAHWRKMVSALTRKGYDIDTWCLDAADFGTAQHRIRSFTIASKIGIPDRPRITTHQSAKIAFSRVRLGDEMHVWPIPSALAAKRIKLIPTRGDWRDVANSAPDLCPPSWFRLGCQATDVWGRIDPSCPANTLKTRFQNPSTGRYLHPTQDRVISLREGARLQGIPDSWKFVGNPGAIAQQIGNGVPIPLSFAVAKQIAAQFRKARFRKAA